MKNIILISILFLTFFVKSQKPNDTIDTRNINLELLDSLIFEKCNQERVNNNLKPFLKNRVSKLASDYQARYLTKTNTFSHYNNSQFENVFLRTPRERAEYFNNKEKTDFDYQSEVLHMRPIFYNSIITYDQLASKIMTSYMNSHAHRYDLLSPQIFSETYYCDFTTKIRIDYDVIYFINCGSITFKFKSTTSTSIVTRTTSIKSKSK